jgi:hypothetical protein
MEAKNNTDDHRVDSTLLGILQEMAKIPAAIKSWRLPVSDAFNDSRFFKMTPEESVQWKPLVCGLMDSDKERVSDLLGELGNTLYVLTLRPYRCRSLGQHLHEPRAGDDLTITQPPPAVVRVAGC